MNSSSSSTQADRDRHFAILLFRAFAGAILFSFPMLMTMEMWWLGFNIEPLRLTIFIGFGILLLTALSYYAGFDVTYDHVVDLADAMSAFAVGVTAAALMLVLFRIVGPGMSSREIVGKIAVQAVPASIGAMLARAQLGEGRQTEEKRRSERFGGGLFLMSVGAFYLSASLASTEEMVLISYKMSPLNVLLLMVVSLVMLHAFVHSVAVRGKGAALREDVSFWPVFLRFTVAAYGLALLISLYILWTFGRTDGQAAGEILQATIVLGFPAALGAGAARLII